MKYLILLALSLVSLSASAIECNVLDVTNKLDLAWTAPTHREANLEGVEVVLKPEEIAGYDIVWQDVDAVAGNTCSVFLAVPAAVSASINLEPGINYKINLRTVDVGNVMSSSSPDILVTTLGAPLPPVPPTSPPVAPGSPRITTY